MRDPEIAPEDEKGLPRQFALGQNLNWNAPWLDICLWVELPFWLMVDNTSIRIEVEGHGFQVAFQDNYFELHGGIVTDSRKNVCYRGPMKQPDALSDFVKKASKDNPGVPFMWRKCKTVMKIATRCNEDVWNARLGEEPLRNRTAQRYLGELCKAHIPVVNRLIQCYRLATYDYYAYEVAPWDVPRWLAERNGEASTVLLVPYCGWDMKPTTVLKPGERAVPYNLIQGADLGNATTPNPTPGELELLDALNLMARGDYSGAVRRVTTAIEVIVAAVVGRAIEATDGKIAADKVIS